MGLGLCRVGRGMPRAWTVSCACVCLQLRAVPSSSARHVHHPGLDLGQALSLTSTSPQSPVPGERGSSRNREAGCSGPGPGRDTGWGHCR